jgi:RimJ/RimL family protein N-acetyltransferase
MTDASHLDQVGIQPVEIELGEWVLRPPRPDDADEALTMLSDPDVRQWNPVPSVVDLADAERWLARGADWKSGDHATFSVVETATGRFFGSVSLFRIDREQAGASIGYRVAPGARGRGVATAAVEAVTEWSFREIGLARVELCHAVTNPASCRVAVKTGYSLEGTLRQSMVYGDGKRYDEHIHGRLASDPRP